MLTKMQRPGAETKAGRVAQAAGGCRFPCRPSGVARSASGPFPGGIEGIFPIISCSIR